MNKHDSKELEATLFSTFARKLAGDTLRYIPASLVPAAMGLLSVSIFTRLFDLSNYGRFSLVMAAATILTMALSGWIQQSVVRYLPRYVENDGSSEFTTKLFAMLMSFSLAALAVFLITYPIVRERLGPYTIFYFPAILFVVSDTIFLSLNTVFLAIRRSSEFSAHKVMVSVLRLSLSLVFVLLIKHDVVGLFVGAVAANLLVIVPMMARLDIWRHLGGLHKLADATFLKMFAAYGLPMVGWLIGGQILAISDRFIIGIFHGSSDVGIYSANYNMIAGGFGLVSTPISIAASPIIIKSWEQGNRERIGPIISAFSRYYLLAALPFVAFVSVFSREIAATALGSEFHDGYVIMPFVGAGLAVWGFSMFGHKGLEIMERTRVMLLLVFVCVIVNLSLNLIFVPKFGYIAAAVATLVSYLLYPFLVHRVTRSIFHWSIPWRSAVTISAAAIIAGVALALLRGPLLNAMPSGIALLVAAVATLFFYAVLLAIFREFKRHELQFFGIGRRA